MEKSKLKNTHARTLILEFLKNKKKPVSIDDIYKHVEKDNINQSTVYRTVNSFLKENIINPIVISKDKLYVEFVNEDNHHHHIICTDCKKISDFNSCDVENIIKKVLKENKEFNKITKHSFELFGLCKSCSKK